MTRTPVVKPAPRGTWPVLFTPFAEDKSVDYEALDALVDFYVEAGVGGLFACCLSSEVFDLTRDEMLETSRRVAKRAAGRVGVVAGANFGATLEEQAQRLDEMFETGVDAAVILVSTLPRREGLGDQILEITNRTTCPLGIYECPVPERRHLTPDEVGRIAHSSRFTFMKDTRCDLDDFRAKVQAAAGTPLGVFQANCKLTPASLDVGAAGHCGVMSNVCPELSAALCARAGKDTPERGRIQDSIQIVHEVMTKHHYPVSGKYILQRRGVPMTYMTRCQPMDKFTAESRDAIDSFLESVDISKPFSDEQVARFAGVKSPGWFD